MSTLKTNNIQHVDRSDPSIIINTDGGVSIAGTLTYEDVTSVDAVGIVTAREILNAQKQVHVGTGVSVKAGGLNVTAGISTFGGDIQAQGDVSIVDTIYHAGDTNTKIRFPSADTISFETGGSERVRIDSSGRILKGLTSSRGNYGNNTSGVDYAIQVEGLNAINATLALVRNSNDGNDGGIVLGKTRATSVGGNTVVQAGDDLGNLTFAGSDGTSLLFGAEIFAEVQSGVGNDDLPTDLIFKTNSGTTSTTERVRIKDDGKVGIGVNDPDAKLEVLEDVYVKGSSGDGSVGIQLRSGGSALSNQHQIRTGGGTGQQLFIEALGASSAIVSKTNGSEALRIDVNGRVITGHNAALTLFHGPYGTNKRNPHIQVNGTTVNSASMSLTSWDDNVVGYYGPAIFLAKSGSSTIGTNSRLNNANSILGSVIFSGDDGDEFIKGAMIQGAVDGATGGNDMPGRLMFHTTADGAQEPIERLRISADGTLTKYYNSSSTQAIFPGVSQVNGVTGIPSQAGTPFVVARDTGTTRSAHFAGNLKFDSGYGIDFSPTGGGSNTSSESELFNDYEEGSCAILIHDAVGSNISVTGGNHKYTKIGNKVFVEGQFTFAESGSKNGGLMILYQLPFVPAQSGLANGTYWYDGNSDAADVTGIVYVHTASNGQGYLKQSTTIGQPSNNKYLTFNEIQKNSSRPLYLSFSYITDS